MCMYGTAYGGYVMRCGEGCMWRGVYEVCDGELLWGCDGGMESWRDRVWMCDGVVVGVVMGCEWWRVVWGCVTGSYYGDGTGW